MIGILLALVCFCLILGGLIFAPAAVQHGRRSLAREIIAAEYGHGYRPVELETADRDYRRRLAAAARAAHRPAHRPAPLRLRLAAAAAATLRRAAVVAGRTRLATTVRQAAVSAWAGRPQLAAALCTAPPAPAGLVAWDVTLTLPLPPTAAEPTPGETTEPGSDGPEPAEPDPGPAGLRRLASNWADSVGEIPCAEIGHSPTKIPVAA